jgi:NADH/F420H2 dehydrogenase subunit C
MDTKILSFVQKIILLIPKFVKIIEINNNQLIIVLKTEHLLNVLNFLKKNVDSQVLQLIDLTAVDMLNSTERFVLVYQLLSLRYNIRIQLKIFIEKKINSLFSEIVPSCTSIFRSAGWLEREVWDMFGIYFSEHPDLRRILTDYGFQGFPLRKDFPLSGFCELRYDEELKSVFYDSLELSQEFRFFDFHSPWVLNSLK